jgi:hypothetical protein
VGGAAEVVDAAWGAIKVEGTAQEAVEVGEAGDGGAAQGRAVGPPAPIPGVVGPRLGSRLDRLLLFRSQSDRLSSWSDRLPLFPERSDRLGERSDR